MISNLSAQRHLKRIGNDARTTVSDVGSAISDIAHQTANDVQKAGRSGYRKAVRTTRGAVQTVRREIVAEPWRALGIAAGIGFVFGFMLRRRI